MLMRRAICPCQVTNEPLEGGWGRVGVLLQDLEQGLRLGPKARGRQLLGVLLGRLGAEEAPGHQSSLSSSSSTGVAMPSRMDSRMPGIETRCSVSCTARQSL